MVFRFSRFSLPFDLLDEDESIPVSSLEPSQCVTDSPRKSRDPGSDMVANHGGDPAHDAKNFLSPDFGEGFTTVCRRTKNGRLCESRRSAAAPHKFPVFKSGPTHFFPYKSVGEVPSTKVPTSSSKSLMCTSRASAPHFRGIRKLQVPSNQRSRDETNSASARRARERPATRKNGKGRGPNKYGHEKVKSKQERENYTVQIGNESPVIKKQVVCQFKQQWTGYKSPVTMKEVDCQFEQCPGCLRENIPISEERKTSPPFSHSHRQNLDVLRQRAAMRTTTTRRILTQDAPAGRLFYQAQANAVSVRRRFGLSFERARQFINAMTPGAEAPVPAVQPPTMGDTTQLTPDPSAAPPINPDIENSESLIPNSPPPEIRPHPTSCLQPRRRFPQKFPM